jgi:hypothetical protein
VAFSCLTPWNSAFLEIQKQLFRSKKYVKMYYKIRRLVIYIERQNPLNKELVGINMSIRRGVYKIAFINITESLGAHGKHFVILFVLCLKWI